jgi:hypothetical protein
MQHVSMGSILYPVDSAHEPMVIRRKRMLGLFLILAVERPFRPDEVSLLLRAVATPKASGSRSGGAPVSMDQHSITSVVRARWLATAAQLQS